MVGLGSQDTFDEAQEFVGRFGTTFEMLWDPTFESWAALGVSLQPSSLLLSPDGSLLGRWLGLIPENKVLELAAGAPPVGETVSGSSRFCRYAARYKAAHAAFEKVDETAIGGRPLLFDDIRFGANAMAQTAPADLLVATRVFADEVQALARTAIDAKFDLQAAATAGYADRLTAVGRATSTIRDEVNKQCDVQLT